MTITSADIETGAVGSHLVRTPDGAILGLTSGVTVLGADDDFQLMPIGSKLTVAVAAPSLAMTLTVPIRHVVTPERPDSDVVTTTGLTSVAEIVADRVSWAEDFQTP